MAGLLAARVLSDAYEHVTVLDRDRLPAGMEGRRAVPQGRHAHALLSHGQACLDELLPGFSAELVADGAPACRALEDMHYVVAGHELARAATGAHSILASRPFIEGHVRRRIRALPGITIRDEVDALGVTAGDRTRVDGVRILSRADGSAEEILSADLVVAATGRAARVPAWLETLGHPRPREQKVMLDVTYATRHLRMPAGALGGDKFVLVSAKPGRPRALFLFAQEADTWVLSIGGYGRAPPPPRDPGSVARFPGNPPPPGGRCPKQTPRSRSTTSPTPPPRPACAAA